MAVGGRRNRAGLAPRPRRTPCPPGSAQCRGPQQRGPPPGAVASRSGLWSAPGSPGPPPFFPRPPPALSSGWDDETAAAPGVRSQSSGSEEAGDLPGDPGQAPWVSALSTGRDEHCLVCGWAGHWAVCARPAGIVAERQPWAWHGEAMVSAGRPERWPCWGLPGQLGSQSRVALDTPGLPSNLQPQSRTARSFLLGPALRLPRPPPRAGA